MPQTAPLPNSCPLCDNKIVSCVDIDDFAAHAYLMVLPKTEQRCNAAMMPYRGHARSVWTLRGRRLDELLDLVAPFSPYMPEPARAFSERFRDRLSGFGCLMENDALFAELAQLDARIRRLETGVDGAVATSWAELYPLFGEEMPGADLGLRTADLAAATIAGLAGGVLDLQSAISSALTSEELHQRLDAAFKEKVKDVTGQDGTVSIDNALGGGRNHRLVGPTHDLFRLFSAVRAVQNGQFVSAVKGVRMVNSAYREGLPPYLKVESPGDALILVLMHWASDFFSAQSLPIPGWSRLAEINDRDFVEWLFRAYREGTNLRAMVSQFLSNLSGLALISIVLHLYRYIDMFWVTERRPIKLATFNLSNDLRFRWMSRNANLTAMTVSTAHAALTQNFFAWNYMSFVKFFADARAVEKILDTRHAEIDARTERLLQDLTGSNA